MSSTYLTATILIQASAEPSLWRTIAESLPSDPASLFTLALVVGVTGLVVYSGRKGGGKGKGPA